MVAEKLQGFMKQLSKNLGVGPFESDSDGVYLLEVDDELIINVFSFSNYMMLETNIVNLPDKETQQELCVERGLQMLLAKAYLHKDSLYLDDNQLVLQSRLDNNLCDYDTFKTTINTHLALAELLFEQLRKFLAKKKFNYK